ncbi:MAG: GGDEF domain-containing protein [Clostridia bacterium]|nr:GGDEF domain-containing protein [Clostridia bacterium]
MSDIADVNKSEKDRNSGFRLEIFNFFIIIMTVAIVISLSIIIFKAHETYDEFLDATNEYIACREAAEDVHNASDYLTTEAREFAKGGDIAHMLNYFNEAKNEKSRDKALETIKRYDTTNGKDAHLEVAVDYSNQLMYIEYYSMRLRLEADGVNEAEYPEDVRNTALNAEDSALTAQAKREKAREMLSDKQYTEFKEKIYNNINTYTDNILIGTQSREQKNSKLFTRYQDVQIILIILLLGILTINVSFTFIFMIRPLRKSSKLIVNQMSLPETGATEMRTFARVYNGVLKKIKMHQEQLTYEASHDSLTGIHNRSVFDDLYQNLDTTENLAFLIVDIDAFKEINDTFGHLIGDKVLKKVANLLHMSFRSDDTICRIGGDEFALVLNGVTEESREQLDNKLDFIMRKVSETTDKLPPFTLSIGAAFGAANRPFKTLYKNADKALYEIKSTTKNGIKFYEDK